MFLETPRRTTVHIDGDAVEVVMANPDRMEVCLKSSGMLVVTVDGEECVVVPGETWRTTHTGAVFARLAGGDSATVKVYQRFTTAHPAVPVDW